MSNKHNIYQNTSAPDDDAASAAHADTAKSAHNAVDVTSIVDQAELATEKLVQELAEANAKAQANWDLLLRSRAETENIRRRGQVDVEKAHKFSIEGLARELLNVVDSLDKALELAMVDQQQMDPMQQGMQLTHKLLLDTLDKFGVKEINPQGEMFDPAKHEALAMQPSDQVAPNSVIMVAQKGFSIHERILRPARVIVARPPVADIANVDERA